MEALQPREVPTMGKVSGLQDDLSSVIVPPVNLPPDGASPKAKVYRRIAVTRLALAQPNLVLQLSFHTSTLPTKQAHFSGLAARTIHLPSVWAIPSTRSAMKMRYPQQ
jgi:hypothetical protein